MKLLNKFLLLALGATFFSFEINARKASTAAAPKMVCIRGDVPAELEAKIRCRAHFSRKTTDGYECFIRFPESKAIQVINLNDVEEIEMGKNAIATYPKKTKKGVIVPQALEFQNAGQGEGMIDVDVLDNRRATLEEIATAIGAQPLIFENNLTNFIKMKKELGKPFADCADEWRGR